MPISTRSVPGTGAGSWYRPSTYRRDEADPWRVESMGTKDHELQVKTDGVYERPRERAGDPDFAERFSRSMDALIMARER